MLAVIRRVTTVVDDADYGGACSEDWRPDFPVSRSIQPKEVEALH